MENQRENRNYDRDNDNQRQERDQKQRQAQHRDQNSNRNADTDTDKRNKNNNDSNRDIESRWHDIESDYRRRYPNLTQDDVNYRQGEFDNMTDRIAKRTNRNRQQVRDEIENWQNS